MTWVALALASGGFLSYPFVRFCRTPIGCGAGLVGALWGVALLAALPLDPIRQFMVWLGVLAISVVVSDVAEEALGVTDDPRIVIDEFIGYWTALLVLPRSGIVILLAFILFRIFDVWKPGPIRMLANLPGGWGVVLDDIAAGALANLCLQALRWIRPF